MKPITAVEVLRAAKDRAHLDTVKTKEVQQALRALKPHCLDRWPLDQFWTNADYVDATVRAQLVSASFKGILNQLGCGRSSTQAIQAAAPEVRFVE